MTTTLTDVEKIRRLPWLLAADTLNTMFFSITLTGSVFLLFLDELGLNEGQIGFLLSLIPFCGIVALFVAPTVAHFGYKRVFVTFWGIRKFVISLLLLTPAFVAHLHTLTIALPQLNSTRSNYPNSP
jgi:preprotein translocase subunit SecY